MHVEEHPGQRPVFRSKNRMHFLRPKITFGENGESLVNYGENAESGRFRKKSKKGDETPTQYRSNAHFGTFQKTQKCRVFTHPRIISKNVLTLVNSKPPRPSNTSLRSKPRSSSKRREKRVFTGHDPHFSQAMTGFWAVSRVSARSSSCFTKLWLVGK